ncbi:MAG: hypothetical protein NZM37_12445 [Sandaracinaceae bacterium]|nr:hypothetical protein [Sandaracinaceae bacterium]
MAVSTVRAIAAGYAHTCALVDQMMGVQVMCWGANRSGQLGSRGDGDRLMPVLVMGLGEAQAIAAGYAHTCALLRSGQVWCWGWNNEGQLGNEVSRSDMRSPTPVSVMGLSGVQAISAGGAHTCALLTSGEVRCWGANGDGQLGDGATTNRTMPTPVSGL